MFSEDQKELLIIIKKLANSRGEDVYLVGGAVRDILLDGSVVDNDLDFMVTKSAADMASELSKEIGGTVTVFNEFLTAKVRDNGRWPTIREIDFARARTETYTAPGALPAVLPADMKDDLKRRDFSINALAAPITVCLAASGNIGVFRDGLVDYFNGRSDLDNKLIRVLHNNSFTDDPTRIFRGARYAVRMRGSLESATAALARESLKKGALHTISSNRIYNELKKILAECEYAKVLELLQTFSIIGDIFEFNHEQSDLLISRMKWAELNLNITVDEKFILSFITHFEVSGEEKFGTWIRKFGLGKRVIKEVEQARSWRLGDSPSRNGLIYRLACSPTSTDLKAEAQRQGLL